MVPSNNPTNTPTNTPTQSNIQNTPTPTQSNNQNTPTPTQSSNQNTPPTQSNTPINTSTQSSNQNTPPTQSSNQNTPPQNTKKNINPIIFPTPEQNMTNYINKLSKYTNNELNDRTKSIEKVLQLENRWNKFTDTYNKRYIEYIKIISIFVFSMVCIWLCITIEKQGILPQGFLTFLIIIILGITVIWIYYIYQNVLLRNLLIFDEIDYKSPALEETNEKPTGTPNANNKTPCPICPANYVYDGEYCIYNPLSNNIN
jgi:hypothetical protein